MADNNNLTRLGFVEIGAARAAALGAQAYDIIKQRTPASLQPKLEAAEATAVAYSAPYLTKGAEVLRVADLKVDASIKTAYEKYEANTTFLATAVARQREAHADNLQKFQEARKEYLQKVEASLAYVREHGVTGTAKAASDVLLAAVHEAQAAPQKLLHEVDAAWHRLLELPAVKALVEGGRERLSSSVGAAYARYSVTRDKLVADPRYAAAVAKGEEYIKSVQATSFYQAAAARLITLPYVDVGLKSAAPYLEAARAHLAPVEAA